MAGSSGVRPQPPTSAEVERGTQRFLDTLDESDRSRARAAGTGGAGRGSKERLFPDRRLIAFYGAPQMGATILGRKSIGGAKRKLRKQARRYGGAGMPVIEGMNLVAVIATADRGSDGKYRTRQSNRVIEQYHDAARQLDGRLILDIQPGRSGFMTEVRALDEWLERPDVDIALDPEWNVGKRGRPGRTRGSVNAKALNKLSAYMDKVVARENLPPKALVVHQFHNGSVRKRHKVKQRDDVAVTLNFDGIGGRAAKVAGYERLTRDELFAGFSLFYRLDNGLMTPRQVTRLDPTPNYVLYQ
ncbi:MAG TPA: hypothetical protein VK920_08230 [Solirubrobacterales bacterium]|nr:hypothetical protein [Solirubrobacterales bacterium]